MGGDAQASRRMLFDIGTSSKRTFNVFAGANWKLNVSNALRFGWLHAGHEPDERECGGGEDGEGGCTAAEARARARGSHAALR